MKYSLRSCVKISVNIWILILLLHYKHTISNAELQHPKLQDKVNNFLADDRLETLVIIPTLATAEEKEYRKFIRETWKKTLPKNTKLLFFIGVKELYTWNKIDVENELEEHSDIVQLNISETYEGLSTKMAEIYSWINKACHNRLLTNVKWIFKTDTDVWFNPSGFFDIIKSLPNDKTWIGSLNTLAPVLRRGPWKNTQYTALTYPFYNAGAGYALSLDIVNWIGTNYDNGMLKIMPNEDALVGIWLAGLDINIIDTPYILPQIGRHGKKLDAPYNTKCSDKVFLIHNMSLKGLKHAFVRYHKCGTTCENQCKITNDDIMIYFK